MFVPCISGSLSLKLSVAHLLPWFVPTLSGYQRAMLLDAGL